ncbi:CAP domain-containing protein [Streptomyces sp. SYSU K217416]
MSSRRSARSQSRSHARPKGGLRSRNVLLALGVITVTAGVGGVVAAGAGDQGGKSDSVETAAAGEISGPSGGAGAAGSASPLASPSAVPSGTASPSASATASATPKRTASPSAAPTAKAKTKATTGRSGTGTSGGGTRPAPGGGSGGSGGGGGSSDGVEGQVVALVNKERAAAGCSPVTSNAKLTRAADDYSDVMAASGVMSHTGPDGSTMTSRVEAAGYVWSTLGENIARGQADAAAVMNSWMNSPGHRANILNCAFKEIGVGVHAGDGGPWWTQNFGASR